MLDSMAHNYKNYSLQLSEEAQFLLQMQQKLAAVLLPDPLGELIAPVPLAGFKGSGSSTLEQGAIALAIFGFAPPSLARCNKKLSL